MSLIQTMDLNGITLHTGKQEAYYAWALAPMFEKSATKLKPKSKLRRYKNIVNIVTFNVKTSNTVNTIMWTDSVRSVT